VLEPFVVLNDEDETLTEAVDYTVSYSNNTDVGTAGVTITGTGNYSGSLETTFEIIPKDVSALTVGSIADQEYTGGAHGGVDSRSGVYGRGAEPAGGGYRWQQETGRRRRLYGQLQQ